MSKFTKGDTVIITRHGQEDTIGIVENWRGGGVAPYIVRILECKNGFYKVGDITYLPGRDMELKEMQGKKKIYCCVPKCSTYSFESSGTIQWQCHKHLPTAYQDCDAITLEQKVDLILEHLKLDVSIQPQKVVLVDKAD